MRKRRGEENRAMRGSKYGSPIIISILRTVLVPGTLCLAAELVVSQCLRDIGGTPRGPVPSQLLFYLLLYAAICGFLISSAAFF